MSGAGAGAGAEIVVVENQQKNFNNHVCSSRPNKQRSENNPQSNNHVCSSRPNNDRSHWVHQDQTNNDQKIINQLTTCVD
jgi:hypothetical protein